MNGMATNCAIGLMRNAVSGAAASSTLCANPNTRPLNPALSTPNSSPHTSTETSESP